MSNRQVNKKKLCLMGIDEDTKDADIRNKCEKFGKLVDFYRVTKSPSLAFAEYDSEK